MAAPAAATPNVFSPVVVGSPAFQHPSLTPSPAFQYPFPTPPSLGGGASSVASTEQRRLKHATSRYLTIALRSSALLFSFVSAIALAVPPPRPAKGESSFSFRLHPGFIYCIVVVIMAALYSSVQLFRNIWDMAFKGFILSEKTSDYLSFILDQVMAYLVFSSSSVAVAEMDRIGRTNFQTAATVAIVMSFLAFLAIAASALSSGYKLCKRISW